MFFIDTLLVYLIARVTERERDGESSICWFTSHMVVTAREGPSVNQEFQEWQVPKDMGTLCCCPRGIVRQPEDVE